MLSLRLERLTSKLTTGNLFELAYHFQLSPGQNPLSGSLFCQVSGKAFKTSTSTTTQMACAVRLCSTPVQYACAVRLCSTRRKILEDVKSHNWELRSPRDRHFSPWNPRRSQKMSRSVRSVIGCPWRKAYTTSNVSIAFHVVEYRLIQKWQAGCSVAGRWRSVLDQRRRHVMLHLLIAKVSEITRLQLQLS